MSALAAAGIQPVSIVGCSVGALNAAFVCSGVDPTRTGQLEDRWRALQRGDVFGGSRLGTVRNILARRASLFSPDPLKRLVDAWLPASTFEGLAVPLRVVTTSLTTGRPVYHDRGPLHDVLLASAALPGLFPPVHLPTLGGPVGELHAGPATELHVDGGISDLVPLRGALDFSPTDVWVLDVAASPGTVRGRVRPVRSAFDVLVASLAASMRARPLVSLDGVAVHHLALRADETGPGRMMDFRHSAELIEIGRATAQTAIELGNLTRR
jgi:NTE family protein